MSLHEAAFTIDRPSFLGGETWELRSLSAVTVLFGRNGSGKSLLLRTLRDRDQDGCHYVVPERSGDITFDPNLVLQVIEAAQRRSQSAGNFAPNYRQQVVTRIQGYYTRRGTKKAAELDHDPDTLLASMSLILPDFTVRVKPENPFYDLRRVADDLPVNSVSALSSGESQLLSLGLDILTIVGIWELDKRGRRILLLDEPDAHIHPDLQLKLAEFLCYVEREFKVQIIVATHSTTLLAALGQFGGPNVGVMLLIPQERVLVAAPFSRVTKELTAFLGGHLLMGPLFGAPILLVEGDDDYRVWVQVARSGKAQMCVLPCNGDEIKDYQRTLERMFAAISERTALRGVALVDGDKYSGALPNATYVPFMKLQCHETENLYLTDEVLQEFGLDWGLACQHIGAAADSFGQKAPLLRALVNTDRRTGDVKSIISQVAEILDPKQLLWTVRLGKILGRQRPTGMLADYLGVQLVEHFWPEPAPGSTT